MTNVLKPKPSVRSIPVITKNFFILMYLVIDLDVVIQEMSYPTPHDKHKQVEISNSHFGPG